MDLLYIHPSRSLNRIGYCIFPTGIISILNYLKEKNISVVGLNYPMEKCLNKNFNLKNFLQNKKFNLIAIDLHWHQHSFGAIEIANFLKKIYKDVPVVLGGYTATFFAKEILENFPEIDFIIKGDGHIPLLQLIQNIKNNKDSYEDIPNLVYRREDKIVENLQKFTLEELDSLNFVEIDFLNNHHHYYRTHLHYYGEKIPFFVLAIASGCLYNCISCSGSKYSSFNILKRNFLVRSSERIFQDLEYLYKIGIKKIWLSHDLQSLGKENYMNLFYRIRKNKLKIGLVMDIWQTIDGDFLREFSQTVLKEYSTLTISPISGEEGVRKKFGKIYNNREFIKTVSDIKKENIPVEIYFSYYLPDEDLKKFKKTLSLIKITENIFFKKKVFLECKPAILDPGSILFDNPNKYNVEIINKNFGRFYKNSGKAEFLYKIRKNMIGYRLKKSDLAPLFLYIFWFSFKIKILFKKLLEKIF